MQYKASVIVSVYNHWNWLYMILRSLECQTQNDIEIIIADDGSDSDMVNHITDYIASSKFTIKHIWHQDDGWRKNIILNKAVAAAESDYLIIIDGDCIPHPKFVADHLRLRSRGYVVSGRRMQLPKSLTAYFDTNLYTWNKDSYNTLIPRIIIGAIREGLKHKSRCLRLPMPFGIKVGMRNHSIMGCNVSLYKDDLLAVNGYDERYVDPGCGEDTDLELRLVNNGMKVRKVSHYALMYHRNHTIRMYKSPNNDYCLKYNIDNSITYTEFGINKKG